MLARGKLGLLPHASGNREAVARIFERCVAESENVKK
jgi:hypothetical protein